MGALAGTGVASDSQVEREQRGPGECDVGLECGAEGCWCVAQFHEVQAHQAYLDQRDRQDRAADRGRRAVFDAQQPARERGQDQDWKIPTCQATK